MCAGGTSSVDHINGTFSHRINGVTFGGGLGALLDLDVADRRCGVCLKVSKADVNK